ncbi:hypothetical protein CHH28_07700 [Bacterioplanes sanyensis]|uniref:DnaT DNA-binding domain-containing protein n=1 Tax=Bacterioplanes sanyensis TaxID=1249553 RepID=A0A222FHN8_9GAMM|nr:DnaT-like ssDNA-binding domain-containing protein [Bacterioplanes sanyensis]ASP38565.1 hypothetical protein CHH28_07700 [Bacterioplanes sanyensis]
MPSHPLFTDRTIALSSTLAATIGLEEAVLLTVLNDAACAQMGPVIQVTTDALRQQLPFWDDISVRRVLGSLLDKGLLQLQGPGFAEAHALAFSFATAQPAPQATFHHSAATSVTANQGAQSQNSVSRDTPKALQRQHSSTHDQANQAATHEHQHRPLTHHWQPQEDTLKRLEQHGIPRSFAMNQRDVFMLQGQEQGANRNDWNTRFFRHVKQHWVYTQNDAQREKRHIERTGFQPQQEQAQPIAAEWQPSQDACQILQRAGVDPQFIDDAVPEFVLYWSERGDAFKTWNSKFIQHVRQQWARYSASVEHSSLPAPISEQWRPAEDCFDILAMGHIDRQFAERLVGEFVLYWRDSGQAHNSWNSRFLQYVKQQWARRLAQPTTQGVSDGQSATAQPHYATAEASVQRLKDTSW